MKRSIKLLATCMLCSPTVLLAQQDSISAPKMKAEYGRSISFEQKESTTAPAVATAERLSHKTSINASNMLFGLIPGLQVMQNADNAWNDGATLNIRGAGSTSSRSPLILVDGFERSINQLSADEIESVTVLKDAVGTALYGIRGANGVICVKTKRGSESAPQINFSYQFNFGTPKRLPELVDGYTYANALNEARVNDGLDRRYSADELNAFQTQSHPYFYPNVNWIDEALRDHSYGDNATFSASGGGKFVRYYTSLNFLDDRGILQPTEENDGYSTQFKYSRLSVRTNLDIDFSPTTKVQLNVLGNFSEHNRPSTSTQNIFNALYTVPAGAFPIKTQRGAYAGTSVYNNNPIANIAGTGYARAQARTMYADMKLMQDMSSLVKGLSLSVRVGLDNTASYWDSNSKNFGYESATINLDTNEETYNTLRNEGTLSFGKEVGSNSTHFNFEASANYARNWGKHALNATLLYAMDKSKNKGQNTSSAFMDAVGQVHYAYNNRYILDISLSGSASSILEPGNRWGLFPAVGAGWILSEESALKSDWLNLLKLRASYGIAGRADYGMNLYKTLYGGGNSYYFKDTPGSVSGKKITQLGVDGLTYEKSHKLNVGIDLTAFNKLSFTIDGYYDHRTDILVSGSNTISSIFGVNAPNVNDGVVNSYGVESSLRWTDRIGDFNYQVGRQLTFARNKIINQNEQYRAHDYLKRTGKSVGQVFGYEVEGIYQNWEEINNRPVKQYLSQVQPGDLKFKDQNGDNRIDEYDQVALGYSSSTPEIYYSFDLNLEYKGFGVYALFQGLGRYSKILDTASIWRPMTNNSTISTEYYNNRWTPETPDAKYPRLTSTGSANNYSVNSLWVADASYLKLRTLEVYYDFQNKTLRHIPVIKKAKLFARGHDLLSIDKIKIADPESIGIKHPAMAQCVFGINLSF